MARDPLSVKECAASAACDKGEQWRTYQSCCYISNTVAASGTPGKYKRECIHITFWPIRVKLTHKKFKQIQEQQSVSFIINIYMYLSFSLYIVGACIFKRSHELATLEKMFLWSGLSNLFGHCDVTHSKALREIFSDISSARRWCWNINLKIGRLGRSRCSLFF